jgi:hypothetical protein
MMTWFTSRERAAKMNAMGNDMPQDEEPRLAGELGRALETLERSTGVKGRPVAFEHDIEAGYRPDALVDIDVDGQVYRYTVQTRRHIDRLAALGHIKAQFDHRGERGLLFAPYITQAIARQCRQLDLAFLDSAGNVYLREPGLHVYVTGERPEQPIARGARGGGTASALRVVFVLLCEPALLNAPYREIARAAGVALGTIGWVFLDLEARGHIAGRRQSGNRRFLEPMRLFDEWVTNYPIKLRPKLHARRFRAEDPDWWKRADLAGVDACWSGEVAAHRLTQYLRPSTCTVYIEPEGASEQTPRRLTRFVAANRLRADQRGDIEVLDAFWKLHTAPDYPDVVPPILAYADLIATLDPRNLEVANMIRERLVAHALRQA